MIQIFFGIQHSSNVDVSPVPVMAKLLIISTHTDQININTINKGLNEQIPSRHGIRRYFNI